VCSTFFFFLQVWNCETEVVRLTFQVLSPGRFANSCIFSEDNSLILFGGDDKVVYAYDNITGVHIRSFSTSGCIVAILSTAGKYAVWILKSLLFETLVLYLVCSVWNTEILGMLFNVIIS
jgi:hypothetical protein